MRSEGSSAAREGSGFGLENNLGKGGSMTFTLFASNYSRFSIVNESWPYAIDRLYGCYRWSVFAVLQHPDMHTNRKRSRTSIASRGRIGFWMFLVGKLPRYGIGRSGLKLRINFILYSGVAYRMNDWYLGVVEFCKTSLRNVYSSSEPLVWTRVLLEKVQMVTGW